MPFDAEVVVVDDPALVAYEREHAVALARLDRLVQDLALRRVAVGQPQDDRGRLVLLGRGRRGRRGRRRHGAAHERLRDRRHGRCAGGCAVIAGSDVAGGGTGGGGGGATGCAWPLPCPLPLSGWTGAAGVTCGAGGGGGAAGCGGGGAAAAGGSGGVGGAAWAAASAAISGVIA